MNKQIYNKAYYERKRKTKQATYLKPKKEGDKITYVPLDKKIKVI